jgi:hypothetical protein
MGCPHGRERIQDCGRCWPGIQHIPRPPGRYVGCQVMIESGKIGMVTADTEHGITVQVGEDTFVLIPAGRLLTVTILKEAIQDGSR